MWLRASGVRLTGIGNIKFASDDRDGARAAWAQSAAFGRKAVAAAPNMLQWKLDLAQALQKLSSVSDDESARAQLAEALALLEPLDHDSKLNPAQSGWVKSIRDKLASLK